jgi:hypothetical protein
VDKINRINTFRKFKVKDILELGYDADGIVTYIIKDGVLPDKWESAWDSIGTFSPSVQKNFSRPAFSNHSKGWSANAPQYHRSTTNSAAGFPMV